jgi:hypothetical protein
MTPALRALSAGIVVAAVVWLAGFVFFPLRSLVAVAVVFLLATVVAALGEAGFPAAAPRHPYVSAAAAVIIPTGLVMVFIFVTTPGPIGHRLTLAPPPAAIIDGVPATAIGWCWKNTCADGALVRSNLRTISNPRHFSLALPVKKIDATVFTGEQRATVTIDPSGGIGPMPVGDWTYFSVQVSLDPTGDASYAWLLR